MAATFDPSLSAPKDRIRQRIGDVDEAKAQIQDETIAGYLGMGYSELGVARRLCLDLAAKWARVGDITVDDQRSVTSKIYEHYVNLAKEIELEERKATPAAAAVAGITVGGLNDHRTAIQDRPVTDYPSCDPNY